MIKVVIGLIYGSCSWDDNILINVLVFIKVFDLLFFVVVIRVEFLMDVVSFLLYK